MVNGSLVERQRRVLDCRQTNLQFKAPPLTELGSLAALGRLVLKEHENLFIAGADIRDCFYAVNCPSGMEDFFCLAHNLSREEALMVSGEGNNVDLSVGAYIPCIKVLPMGFSWSFYLIQVLHEQTTLRSLAIPRSRVILDGQPPPTLANGACVAMPYCDNVHSISTDPVACQDGCDKISADLEALGFQLHEEMPASSFVSTLGGEIDGVKVQVRCSSMRMWRLILSFRYITTIKVSAKMMQRLLGHAMTICVLHRAGMSVFRYLYDFVENCTEPRMLSAVERNECLVFSGIIPLLFADLRKPWSLTLTASDASPEGYGICETIVSPEEGASLGDWWERWRFKRLEPEQWAPRRRALRPDVFADVSTVVGDWD